MRKAPNRFIVIEGGDGSGKATQTDLLIKRLEKSDFKIASFDFPQYGKSSAYFAEKYLNNAYGPAITVSPHKASVCYAVDRMETSYQMKADLDAGKILISNRFVASNMAYQGAKIANPEERAIFLKWLLEFEFDILEIPRPSLNIILQVAPVISYALIEQKLARDYIKSGNRDGHEQSLEYQKRVSEMYSEIARLFPDQFTIIDCMDGQNLLSPNEIHDKVWAVVDSHLV